MKRSVTWLPALILALMQMPASAIMVDGDLQDWIAAPAGHLSDWIPLRTSTFYTVEDQNTGYLDPGYGGQAYDAEAMYLEIQDGTLYIAIVTGFSPDNTGYRPGDIAIDFGNDDTFEYGIIVAGDGFGLGNAGEVFQADAWHYGLWAAPNDLHNNGEGAEGNTPYRLAHPTAVRAGSKIGTAVVAYQEARYIGGVPAKLGPHNGTHYVIEAAVSLSMFDPDLLGQKFTVHWTMGCANDWIEIDPVTVPEPPVLLLAGTGLILLGWQRRQSNSRAHRS